MILFGIRDDLVALYGLAALVVLIWIVAGKR